MKLFSTDARQKREMSAVFAITFVITVLLTAFFQTQVLSGEQFAARAEENRLRPVVIPAPRGTIVDRNGKVVATSITGYSISVLPGEEAVIRRTLEDLAPFLGLAGEDVERLMAERNGRPNDLLEVTNRATYSQAAALQERAAAFPNLMVVERPQRYYPAGSAVGHLTGYVTEITREQLRLRKYQEAGYRQGRLIGQAGIELQYELTLAGTDGARFVEVDARGRVVDPRSSVGALAPVSGKPIKLTIDIDLQEYIHEIFPDTMKGSIVAMKPSTGEILALYSHPNYDPNDFVGRIPPQLWRALNTDPDKPLLNRAVTALYPPASTWKTATAAIGVQRGLVTATSRMPLACTGGMAYAGRYARCHYSRGHGSLDLAHAIERSCNVYFYQLGIKLGYAELIRAGTRIGFGRKTGIDLPGEVPSKFPESLEKLRRETYVAPSDVMSLAIGQGPNSQTVLNMAQFYAAIAGNGTGVVPHLVVNEEAREREASIDLGLDREGLEALWEGLRLVTEPEGTAVQSSLLRYKLYGKTGTAQNEPYPDHAWFVGFAGVPGGSPEIVIATIVEHGLHGDAAAPLAAKAVNFYLDKVHGHPFDPRPTWGERIRAGAVWGFDPQDRRLVPPAGARGARAAGERGG
ncbi:MAG TPA: penicillin-binding protein 2 [Longimicrobiaceae bacterium]|nr:penicillin-binding protein 2 [Longimicrobiaceae bacterium]